MQTCINRVQSFLISKMNKIIKINLSKTHRKEETIHNHVLIVDLTTILIKSNITAGYFDMKHLINELPLHRKLIYEHKQAGHV